jgi:hypothetical protein
MERKVLYSPGFGAGWSTWNGHDALTDDYLYDEALIAAVEAGEDVTAAVADFEKRMQAKLGKDAYICVSGADDLRVADVSGPFIVEEYDGSESIRLRDATAWNND